jgi:hypothetical protein
VRPGQWGWPKAVGNDGGTGEEEGANMWGPHVSDGEEVRQRGAEGVTQRKKVYFTRAPRAC